MPAFYFAMWNSFLAVCLWFLIAPLLGEIRNTLSLTKQEIWWSSVIGVIATIATRVLFGPLCDLLGVRVIFLFIMLCASISTGCIGAVKSARGLYILRGFIGVAGAYLLTSQYWMIRMFSKGISGTVCALVAGAGTFGGGVIQRIVNRRWFPAFTSLFDGDNEMAWRVIGIVPALIGLVSCILMYIFTDDTPKERRAHGSLRNSLPLCEILNAFINYKIWILFLHAATSQGLELTMNNAAALYYRDEFGVSTLEAVSFLSRLRWSHWLFRVVGGLLSDAVHYKFGVIGRIIIQGVFLLPASVLVLVFDDASTTLGRSMLLTSLIIIFSQLAQGSTFALVAHFCTQHLGYGLGIISAGGNAGAVLFGLRFRAVDYQIAIRYMGWWCLASSLCTVILFLPSLQFNDKYELRMETQKGRKTMEEESHSKRDEGENPVEEQGVKHVENDVHFFEEGNELVA